MNVCVGISGYIAERRLYEHKAWQSHAPEINMAAIRMLAAYPMECRKDVEEETSDVCGGDDGRRRMRCECLPGLSAV